MGWMRRTWNRIPAVAPSVFLLFGVGLMGAAASFLLFGQIENERHPTHTLWYVLAVVFLIGGAATVLWGAMEARRQWREGAASLELTYDPDDPRCHQVREGQADIQLPVRARNTGRVGLRHVRATLGLDGGHDHWLRIEHDNAAPYRRSLEGEVLPALGARAVYFDVFFVGAGGQTDIQYADDYLIGDSLKWLSQAGNRVEHFVTIRVEGARESDGRTVAEARQRFRITARQQGGNGDAVERSADMVSDDT